jgi:4-diphosphocytidyl-2-C-methyl-D-erythritol kinase
VRIEARAKLNLGLAVGPRRDDGFHDLATVFQSISLADTLIVTPRARGFSLAIRHENASVRSGRPRPGARRMQSRAVASIPTGPANLVLRAARLLSEHRPLPGGARFTLIKLYRVRWTLDECLALAARLGSDVPFAVFGGTALGLGRGERLRRLRLARPFQALVAVPSWRVGTARAFDEIDRGKYALTGRDRFLRFAKAIGRKAVRPGVAMRLGNTFEQVLGERRSGFHSLCERLRRAGVEEPHLTGSGSAVFGIIPAGLPTRRVVARFDGDEAVYLIRSRATSLTHTTLA